MSIIYQPKGRAGEYADWACNIYRGCSHKCMYCYAPLVLKMKRDQFHAEPKVRKNLFPQLEKAAKVLQGQVDRVLLCFTCDPYQPLAAETGATRRTIETLHAHGMGVTILTKGGEQSTVDFDLLGPGDAYATTLTMLSDDASKRWEPNAPPTWERIDALITAKEIAALETWVSFEPVIDPIDTLALLKAAAPFIDHCKVGPLNYAGRLSPELRSMIPWPIDWYTFAGAVKTICDRHNVEVYFKEDLRKLL